MRLSPKPRRALPVESLDEVDSMPRRALPDEAAAAPRRTLGPRRRTPVAAALGTSLLTLAAAFTVVATPAAHAHDPAIGATPSNRDANAVSRGILDRATAAPVPHGSDETPDPSAVAPFRAQQLSAEKEGARQQAASALLKRWAEEEAARQKNYGNAPKDKPPVDDVAPAIYTDRPPAHPTFRLPVDEGKYTLSSEFAATGFWWPYHNGQDFAAPAGTPAYAVTDAIVGPCITEDWAGTHVVLHFADGSSAIYAHLNDSVVHPGQVVHAGDLIGHVGNTGRSFGAHLHFQYYAPGSYTGDFLSAVDPVAWLKSHGLNP